MLRHASKYPVLRPLVVGPPSEVYGVTVDDSTESVSEVGLLDIYLEGDLSPRECARKFTGLSRPEHPASDAAVLGLFLDLNLHLCFVHIIKMATPQASDLWAVCKQGGGWKRQEDEDETELS